MVEFSRDGQMVTFQVLGLHKLWAFRSRVRIPVARLRKVEADPQIARGWWKGLRMPGTHLPNLIIAGSFYLKGKWTFWDVGNADNAIVIHLADHRFDRIVIEVADPAAAVRQIGEWIAETNRGGSARP